MKGRVFILSRMSEGFVKDADNFLSPGLEWRLWIIGLEPILHRDVLPKHISDGQVSVVELRDAAIALSGERPYRCGKIKVTFLILLTGANRERNGDCYIAVPAFEGYLKYRGKDSRNTEACYQTKPKGAQKYYFCSSIWRNLDFLVVLKFFVFYNYEQPQKCSSVSPFLG
eukprot:1160420-Pelagomonas_calceolata.AAC.18